MRTINMHEAKTHLSRLVAAAADGDPFIIARAGKSLVRVVPLHFPMPAGMRRTGFLKGQISVPHDFDRMRSDDLDSMFEAGA